MGTETRRGRAKPGQVVKVWSLASKYPASKKT